MNKILIILIAVGLIGGYFYINNNSDTQNNVENISSEGARVFVEETSYKWRQVGINDGNVEKIFEIKNSGTETLVLSDVITSCMCTTAQLILSGEESPVFGMHSKSNYEMEVPAGETAELKVVFDPAFHGPGGVGPINRQIKVATNDLNNPELNFMLTAVVRR